jgi:hypothetical protein
MIRQTSVSDRPASGAPSGQLCLKAVVAVLADGTIDWANPLFRARIEHHAVRTEVIIDDPSEFQVALQTVLFRETRALVLIYADVQGALTQAALEVLCAMVVRGSCLNIWGRWMPTDAGDEARVPCMADASLACCAS